MLTPEERALADYRASYPEDSDLPDDTVSRMLAVKMNAFRYARNDLGKAVLVGLREGWPTLLAIWLVLLAAALFWG